MTALADSAFVVRFRGQMGELAVRVVDVTFNNAYDAAGWLVTAKQLGFGLSGEIIGIMGGDTLIDGFALNFDRTNKKIVARQTGGAINDPLAEITAEPTLLNAKVARLIFLGRGHG